MLHFSTLVLSHQENLIKVEWTLSHSSPAHFTTPQATMSFDRAWVKTGIWIAFGVRFKNVTRVINIPPDLHHPNSVECC